MMNDIPNKLEFDNEPVANLLHGLKRVDAPNDFDHRVRARIAEGRPQEKGGSIFPVWAKAAIPAALLLGVGGYIGFNSLPTQTQPEMAAVVKGVQPQVPAVQLRPAEMAPPTVAAPGVVAVQPTTRGERAVRAQTRRKKVNETPGGGFVDSALTLGQTLEVNDISATDALTRAGAKVSFEGRAMKVDSTVAAASRAGLKAGDVIESIDGKSVEAKSTVRGSAAGKKLRVLRDGKSLDIVIKN